MSTDWAGLPWQAAPIRSRAPAFVGREAELDAVGRTLAAARAGAGGTLFVTGEPGIGKSRLASQASVLAGELGMAVLRGNGSTVGPAVPFRPMTEALLSLARGDDGYLLGRLGPYRPILGRLIPDWSLDDTGGADASLIVLAEAMLRLTAIAGERSGCLLVIDDLHEADLETVSVIEYFTTNVATLPVAVLVTLRPDPSAALDLARTAAPRGDGVLLEPPRLTATEVHRLVASCLDADEHQVPLEVGDHVARDSDGVPFFVEELVRDLVDNRRLRRGSRGWRLVSAARNEIPPTVAHAIRNRAERLGTECARLLATAAILGGRFPTSILAIVSEMDEHDLQTPLRRALEARLLVPDEREPGWLAFPHRLTANALLTASTPDRRAALSRVAADVVVAMYPELPGYWCQLAAHLEEHAGDPWSALRRYMTMAERALAAGASSTAIAVLDAADAMLTAHQEDERHRQDYRDLLRALLRALAESGQVDRARSVAERLAPVSIAPDDPLRLELAVRLAWAAWVAGRWEEGTQQVAVARSLLRKDSPARSEVEIDAVDAYLTMARSDSDRIQRGVRLAHKAIAGGQAIGLPSAVCQAWYAVGFLTRERDLAESDDCFRQMLGLADEHDLAAWRGFALVGLAGNAWLSEADARPLRYAHAEAVRTGGLTTAYNVAAILSLDAVLRGEFDVAESMVAESLANSRRLRLRTVTQYTLMASAVLAAHRARREELRLALAEFRADGGEASREAPLADGLAKAFFALLHEDRDTAETELRLIAENPVHRRSSFFLAGPSGLQPLLDVLAGRTGRADIDRIAASAAGRMRWNRQFLQLADAVLHGRAGRLVEAEAAAMAAQRSSRPFPTAHHLGMRLVAEPALADGWGRPREWLRAAEDHFHRVDVSPVASACRAIMRRIGEPVRQRRAATAGIPEHLRELGITSREFEVLRHLPGRPSYRVLAERLHISPRTVEKHVASLVSKTGSGSREELAHKAADMCGPQ